MACAITNNNEYIYLFGGTYIAVEDEVSGDATYIMNVGKYNVKNKTLVFLETKIMHQFELGRAIAAPNDKMYIYNRYRYYQYP